MMPNMGNTYFSKTNDTSQENQTPISEIDYKALYEQLQENYNILMSIFLDVYEEHVLPDLERKTNLVD